MIGGFIPNPLKIGQSGLCSKTSLVLWSISMPPLRNNSYKIDTVPGSHKSSHLFSTKIMLHGEEPVYRNLPQTTSHFGSSVIRLHKPYARPNLVTSRLNLHNVAPIPMFFEKL